MLNGPRTSAILSDQRDRLSWPSGKSFRILSLDGGGILGLFALEFLARLESEAQEETPITTCFDLVAGTSTGGLIALGLGAGMSAADIRDIYLDRGREIFPVPPSFIGHLGRQLKNLMIRKYPRRGLNRVIDDLLGDQTIGHSCVRLCVPALDTNHGGEIYVFKTPHHPDYREDWKRPMADVAKATSAAPSYFSPFSTSQSVFVDGGLWSVNPTLVAVVEALSAFDIMPSQVRVLNIGNLERPFRLGRWHHLLGGFPFWGKTIVEAFLEFNNQSAVNMAGLLIGRQNLVRIAAPGEIGIDDWQAAVDRLPSLAKKTFLREGDRVSSAFLAKPASSYNPFYR